MTVKLKPFYGRIIEINGKKVEIPIQLGGMAVRIGTHELAAAVANEGGVGLIGASGMQPEELRKELKKARELSDGIIGSNIMVPLDQFEELVEVSIEEGADLIVFAAGIPKSRDYIRTITKRIPTFLIVSDPRHMRLASSLGFAGAILESGKAGGHLGTEETVTLMQILTEAEAIVDRIREKNPNFIFSAAGGIIDTIDAEFALNYADLIQIGSRLAVSEESNADDNWKNLMVRARHEDVFTIDSPFGMKFRAVKTPFTLKLKAGKIKPLSQKFRDTRCRGCLPPGVCSGIYCIFERLSLAQQGKLQIGLFTIGDSVERITRIEPAKVIVADLMSGVNKALTIKS